MSTAATDAEDDGTADARAKPPFLRRVRIRGYKSIAFCDVTLEPLTILVGRNASGKSNFLDALAFLRDVVHFGVSEAVKRHGGQDAILCRLASGSTVCIEIEGFFQSSPPIPEINTQKVGEWWNAFYSLEINFPPSVPPGIVREQLKLENANVTQRTGYTLKGGVINWDGYQVAEQFHSYINSLHGWLNTGKALLSFFYEGPLLDLVDQIVLIATYNFNPEALRRPQLSVYGGFLERDGSNLASIIETARETEPQAVHRVGQYLLAITTTVEFVDVRRMGSYDTLRFRIQNNNNPLELDAASMSDGTLRALAALVAAFQNVPPHGKPSIVAIEEPETSLHPAAIRALVDALDEATLRTQILLTTHSAEMLDNPTIRPENIRVVQMIDGRTVIAPVDEASVEIVRQKLNTLGGLERDNQLEPDIDNVERHQRLAEASNGSPQ